jgi:hypothetical protein
MPETDNVKLAFLDIELFDNGAAIRGAVLITDLDTKPYEFRITSPIRPSLLQRVLYGNTLDDYVHIELIGVPLLRELREKVNLVLVAKPALLRIRPKLSTPVALLRRDSKSVSDTPDANEGSLKIVTITTHRDFSAETAVAQSLLASVMQKRDFLEPFERLRVALTEAHKQKVGESTTKS